MDIKRIYSGFKSPITNVDCGTLCAPHNSAGIPFCCDICRAVPLAYNNEWRFLQKKDDLWHIWRGDECPNDPGDANDLRAQTPDHLALLACKGVEHCDRNLRTISCRQFPFIPYISSDFRFIGLVYDWDFTEVCWILSHLAEVTITYRNEFVKTFDRIFSELPEDFDSYSELSTEMREKYAHLRKRFPLLHRNGRNYLVSPKSERLYLVDLNTLPRLGPYSK